MLAIIVALVLSITEVARLGNGGAGGVKSLGGGVVNVYVTSSPKKRNLDSFFDYRISLRHRTTKYHMRDYDGELEL